ARKLRREMEFIFMLLEDIPSLPVAPLGNGFHLVDGLPLDVERLHTGLDRGSMADPIAPSGQARKLIPGDVSADGADDRKRSDVSDGKAGPTHELVVDQKTL